MAFLFKFILVPLVFKCVLLQEVDDKKVCYDGYGCFDIYPPFGSTNVRPAGLLPEPPSKIATSFTLFTRSSPPEGQEISLKQIPSSYNPNQSTKLIIHGFMQNSKKKWVSDMKDAFLRTDNFNVIAVDYSKGNGFPYGLAAANARVVGVDVAKLIQELVDKTGANLGDFHIIGHSLGCHVAGYAGERLKGLGRITGLDPAGPLFEFTDNRVKLDPSDAKFVDIIHTDGAPTYKLGFGLLEPAGHVDFYPNGGLEQPNCPTLPSKILTGLLNLATVNIDQLEDVSGCSHVSAYKFFTDSIENKNCSYFGFTCKSKEEFDKGNCLTCSEKGCNRMGFWASPKNDLGNLYLNTQNADNVPFCKFNYQVKLYSNNLPSMKQARGKFTIFLKNGQTQSSTEVLDDSSITYKQDFTSTHLISLNLPMNGPVESISLYFKKTSNFITGWLYDNEWSFKFIDVYDAYAAIRKRFCPVKTIIQSDETVHFYHANNKKILKDQF